MSNQALPAASFQLLQRYLSNCKNLSLIVDKYAPWGIDRGTWDLRMNESVRRQGQTTIQIVSGGQAKGLWLSTFRRAKNGESKSLFEDERYDLTLIDAYQQRWVQHIKDSGGLAFTMQLAERMAAGLGASSVLETALTLDRNTGLPYLPGSSVKGLARAWGLIEVDDALGLALDGKTPDDQPLNQLATILETEPDETLFGTLDKFCKIDDRNKPVVEGFRMVFGSQANAGAIAFLDGIYIQAEAPHFATDVMTPHYVNYFTSNGSQPPAEDDNPNPVSFLTVDAGNIFAFGLIPRWSAFRNYPDAERNEIVLTALDVTQGWLTSALVQLGAGAKTTAGYGFFNSRSKEFIVGNA